ncbi:MAG: ribosome biogenesis GTPase Der [Clostridia bacterium]|nr:ribosome biogenesis GTPase Der [Clostridia bacterium]
MGRSVVAIVGRPNVGKSSLFNYIIGKRISIVEDTPGVTRDRIYADAEWRGRKFSLVDTGGIEPASEEIIPAQMRKQAELAVELADVIVFMVDAKEGMTSADSEIASMLIRSRKPLVLCVNKVDNVGAPPPEIYEFYSLGIGDPVTVSATHGLGIGDLLDAVYEYLPEETEDHEDDEMIKVAVIGKPNAGKSSLVNKILGEDRVIVSDIAGTTRDAVDTFATIDGRKFCFVDTAGMRKRGKISENIEHYSIIRALDAVDRSNVCVIVVDALDGVTEQDTKIAGYANEKGKGIIIAVNKWDLVDKDTGTLEAYREQVLNSFNFIMFAPILFISALTGQRVRNLFDTIVDVNNENRKRISTGMLNDVLNEAVAIVQPPSDKGRRLKIYYMTQVAVAPPTFCIFCNSEKLFHFSYLRYIENRLRKNFGFRGTPLVFKIREKSEKQAAEENVR